LIKDEALRKEFGRRAKEKVSKFNSEQIGKQYLDFLQSIPDENYN